MNSLRPAFMPCIPAMRTGRCLRPRARSAAVTSTTAAPSLTMQQSKSLSGSTTMREAWWSATLMGFCITAFGVEPRMGAERHRHRSKLGAGRAVERHVALHGERGAARRRGQPVVRRFRMSAAGLAVALEVVRPAEDVALPGEAQHIHAGDDVGHASGHRHRRGLQAAGDEAAVGPGLVDEADSPGRTPGRPGRSRRRAASRCGWKGRRYRLARALRLRAPP